MHIRLQLTGDDGYDELNSLRRWLANELEFRRVIGIDEAPVQPCRVGRLAEVFTISATGSGTQTAQATTDSVWLRQRRSTLTVKIMSQAGSAREIGAKGPASDNPTAKVDPYGHG